MIANKNPSNFSRCQEKLGRFVFCKVEFTWKRVRATTKDKEEEKMEEWL
jgi:hypothetical protein